MKVQDLLLINLEQYITEIIFLTILSITIIMSDVMKPICQVKSLSKFQCWIKCIEFHQTIICQGLLSLILGIAQF